MFDDFEDEEDDDFRTAPEKEKSGAPMGALLPPREMAECFGHEAVEKQLLELASGGRMPHAVIFTGPEGIGKATMAFRFARYLLKQGAAKEDEGAGLFGDALPAAKPENLFIPPDDRIFRQVAAGGHPDLFYVERKFDDKKGKLKTGVDVEEVRKIAPFMRMTASQGGWRIAIVDEADTMTRSAQNGILKILEEPPPQALLILISSRPGNLIPTIRSRCRVIPFRAPSKEIFAQLLRREHNVSERDIDVLYDISGGGTGQGLRILNEGGLEAVSRLIALLETWPQWNWVLIHHLAETLGKAGQEDSMQAYQDVFMWIVGGIVKSKARGTGLPAVLDTPALRKMRDSMTLPQWSEFAGKLQDHFDKVRDAALDRRHAITGAFTLLGEAA